MIKINSCRRELDMPKRVIQAHLRLVNLLPKCLKNQGLKENNCRRKDHYLSVVSINKERHLCRNSLRDSMRMAGVIDLPRRHLQQQKKEFINVTATRSFSIGKLQSLKEKRRKTRSIELTKIQTNCASQ